MSYRLKADETVENGVRRIAIEQIDSAIEEVDDSDLGPEETVHQVRKRCKKIRALLRLARPAFESTYQKENAAFRDRARALSEARDATSRIECVDALKERSSSSSSPKLEALDRVRAALIAHRDELYDGSEVSRRLSEFRDEMTSARDRARGWTLDDGGFGAVGRGVKKTYRRARKAMAEAEQTPTVENFHEWRKRVKYHRYHTRLLRPLWETVLQARREELHQLSDLLGDAHDLAVLRRWLVDHAEDMGASEQLHDALAIADERRQILRAHAFPLGRRLFFDAPKQFRKRARAYWNSWRAETKLESNLAYTK